jgi:hypothetical protein
MKKLFSVLLLLASATAFAQTADDIIQKYNTAMGGLDAFKKVQTAKYTGTATVQGTDLPVTIQIVNNHAMRADLELQGQKVTNVYNNGKGWKVNPFQGIDSPTDVEGTELNDFKSQSSIAGSLMDYKELGNNIELLGQEKVEGVNTYKIKATAKEDGRVTTYYIDADKYEMIKAITSRDIMGQSVDVETVFSNPKTFAGLKFYMTRVQSIYGSVYQTISLSNVELNVPVDEKIFNK